LSTCASTLVSEAKRVAKNAGQIIVQGLLDWALDNQAPRLAEAMARGEKDSGDILQSIAGGKARELV
jgi:hypothetical protein